MSDCEIVDATPDLVAAKLSIGYELQQRIEAELGASDFEVAADVAIDTAVSKALVRGFRLGVQIASTHCGHRVIQDWDGIAERRERLTEVIFPVSFIDDEDIEVDLWRERYGG
jgi:hypothetical protein